MSSGRDTASTPRYAGHLAGAMVVLLLSIWFSSGTLSPYACTFAYPAVLHPCGYLGNIDHPDFLGTFLMLDGAPRAGWQYSVTLRRVLFPLLAYPAMKLFGFLYGGVLFSALLNASAVIGFAAFVRKEIGSRGAIACLWILASYPGIAYWAGLPYSYAIIVPACLGSAVILWYLARVNSRAQIAGLALLLGVLFLGYDLLPFFAPAAVLLLIRRRSLFDTFLAGTAMLFPTVVVNSLLDRLLGIQLINPNTVSYWIVVESYLRRPQWRAWATLLLQLPAIAAGTFLYSNFIFLPLLFLLFVVMGRRGFRALDQVELAILLGCLAVFLVLNGAPPYQARWQIRGVWIARIYQPLFVVFLLYIARAMESRDERNGLRWGLVAATALINATICFGPILLNPLADAVYYRFYRHSPPGTMIRNLERYGRRPLLVCPPNRVG